VAVARSGPAAGSSADGRVPSVAPGSARRCQSAPGSPVAMAGDEVPEPSRRPSSRSVWRSAPTASTSARSGHCRGLCQRGGCTSLAWSMTHSVRTSLDSRGPTYANRAAKTRQQHRYRVVQKSMSSNQNINRSY